MKYSSLAFVFLSASCLASDALVAQRFEKVRIDGIAGVKVVDTVIERDGTRAVIRASIDLSVEGNMGFCKFQDFASTLDYRWFEEKRPTYLSVITTACPTPQPLDLAKKGYLKSSRPRTITTTFDLDLYDGESKTITILTGFDGKGSAEIKMSFFGGKVSLETKD